MLTRSLVASTVLLLGSAAGGVAQRPVPVRVQGRPALTVTPRRFSALTANSHSSCALDGNGQAFCWGQNAGGLLGTGNQGIVSLPPTPVVQGGVRYKAIAGTKWTTCAVSTQGRVYCWGGYGDGMLGIGVAMNGPAQTPVEVALPPQLRFRSVALGYDHACALTEDGQAYCWGNNDDQQLGGGVPGEKGQLPVAVQQPAGVSFTAIAPFSIRTCALSSEGHVYCWGWKPGAPLNGTPTPVPAPESVVFTSLTAGVDHVCALTGEGIGYCWGSNQHGQLGDGTLTTRETPEPLAQRDLRFTSLVAGWHSTCGIAAGGELRCWGLVPGHETPEGQTPAAMAPVAPVGFITVATVGYHICAVAMDARIRCWQTSAYQGVFPSEPSGAFRIYGLEEP